MAPTDSAAPEQTRGDIILVTVPCRTDNYAYLIHNPATGETACTDAPEAAPILAALEARGWGLSDILLTHHHFDHTDGVAELVEATGARVTGAAADAARLPRLDRAVSPGETFTVCGQPTLVFDVSGHTIGHIAFYQKAPGLLFTGDSLMAGGCGRMFEGTAPVFYAALMQLAALPPETLVCSGHEYTLSNLRFARTIEPKNPDIISREQSVAASRAKGIPTVPSTLAAELATNVFLRAGLPGVKTALNQPDADAAAVFAAIRTRKDTF